MQLLAQGDAATNVPRTVIIFFLDYDGIKDISKDGTITYAREVMSCCSQKTDSFQI